ncbi:stage III sporulation protein AF [Gorillibacterium massiliense]|uniref:stage III sporulation protein AF n=1 Tax=Gorillibacterium massiliense TaxID=1280390 RepID=UPI0004B16CA0|nr:stage III sporulation protein AF [Gorillibacterium massiliense]
MSWLSSWLKEIIVIVLIAGFADLLLPNKTMQRYVKLVVGMFLLIVMLTPVLRLFRSDWDFETLLRSAENNANGQTVAVFAGDQFRSSSSSNSGSRNDELGQIFQDAQRLKNADQLQARQLVEKQLEDNIGKAIESRLGNPVAAVRVTTKLDEKDQLTLAGVQVTLAAGSVAAESGGSKETKPSNRPIEPVQPVTVNIGSIGAHDQDENASQDASAAKADANNAAKTAVIASIKTLVSADWQLPQDSVEVIPADDRSP